MFAPVIHFADPFYPHKPGAWAEPSGTYQNIPGNKKSLKEFSLQQIKVHEQKGNSVHEPNLLTTV